MSDGTGNVSGAWKGGLLDGLTKSSPPPPTEKPRGGSVNDEPTRSSVAPTPSTLGERCA